jgi:hypothetical protein
MTRMRSTLATCSMRRVPSAAARSQRQTVIGLTRRHLAKRAWVRPRTSRHSFRYIRVLCAIWAPYPRWKYPFNRHYLYITLFWRLAATLGGRWGGDPLEYREPRRVYLRMMADLLHNSHRAYHPELPFTVSVELMLIGNAIRRMNFDEVKRNPHRCDGNNLATLLDVKLQ